MPIDPQVTGLRVEANGIDFYLDAAGPEDGPLVILLHGFPELAYGWRHQILALANAGHRVIAPDQRGYGLTSKPGGVAAYRLDVLVRDVIALADALGARTFSLVGHDWGGIVAWRLASDFGDRIERLAIINAPNLDVALKHMLSHPGQMLKSFYVALFQLPLVPEWVLQSANHAMLAGALRTSSRRGTFSDEEIDVYKTAWSQPGALTAMLNWYRALPALPRRTPKRIVVPTLVIWGDQDTALDASLAEDSLALCDDGAVHHIADATHWVHHERPDEVNRLLASFLA